MREEIKLKKGFSFNFLVIGLFLGILSLGIIYAFTINVIQSPVFSGFKKEQLEQNLTKQEHLSQENESGEGLIIEGDDNIENLKNEEITQFLVSWNREIDNLRKIIEKFELQLWQLSARVAELEKKEAGTSSD